MMINRTVLMSDARNFSADQAINPYYSGTNTDTAIAQAEHDSIKSALVSLGVNVINVPSPVDSQDGVYTANWALIRGDLAIPSRLPNVRKPEEKYARNILEQMGKKIIEIPEGLYFSGQGDALACGNYLFCGSGYRSDEAAQKFVAEQLGYIRIQLKTAPLLDDAGQPVINAISGLPDSHYYDIDLAMNILKEPENDQPGLIAYCPEAFDEQSLEKIESLINSGAIEAIKVSLSEARTAFACNLVSTGKGVVMGDGAPELKLNLEKRGFTVLTPHVQELSKGGGYIRCTTLTMD